MYVFQIRQANCNFQLLDKAEQTPVLHRSEDGVVYLTPDPDSPIFQQPKGEELTNRFLFAEKRDQERSAQSESPLYYLFFRVSCFAGKSIGASTGRQEFDVYPVGGDALQHRFNNSKLIFQHSFYVYISVSKYPF